MNVPDSPELYQELPLAALVPSATNPRKRFDQAALDELADSIANEGILVPILVRPHKSRNESYEIVAGERRFRAAKKAGRTSAKCIVRALSDAQVELHQAIEHVQRVDIHPLEEAEEYEGLAKRHRLSVEEIAAKVSKSPSYVRGRMKLAGLSQKAREWFYRGLLTPATALLVARIPVPSLQDEAVEKIVRPDGAPYGLLDAQRILRDHYMLRLDRATFDPADSQLVPAAGACTTCPKRTGNQSSLFGDIKDPQTCTDPTCFAGKRAKASEIRRAAAEREGRTVVAGKAAEKFWPRGYAAPRGEDFVRATDRCYEDPKGRTFGQLLGKDAPVPVLLENPNTGEFVEALDRKAIGKLLRAKGIGREFSSATDKAREVRAKQEGAARLAVFEAFRARPLELAHVDMVLIARRYFDSLWGDYKKRAAKLWAFDPHKADEWIGALSPESLPRFLLDLALMPDLHVSREFTKPGKPVALEALAVRVGVDVAAIRAQVLSQFRAKTKAKRAPKQESAGKAGASAEPSSGSQRGGKVTGRAKAKARAAGKVTTEHTEENGGE